VSGDATAGPERERDPRGRPQNARPRDGLGRPLPRGTPGGVPRVPDDLVLDPLPALTEAQRLLDAEMPFHAHEVLEASWKAAPPGERDLWQGLAQLAVGLTHLLRGNATGAASLLRRGRDRVAAGTGGGRSAPYGVDAAGLLAWADDLLARLAAGDLPASPAVPRLRVAGPAPRRPGPPDAGPTAVDPRGAEPGQPRPT